MLTLPHFLILAALLFVIGVAGVFLNRKNILIILMSVELMLLAVNLNFHRLWPLSGRLARSDIFHFHSHGRRRRGRHWPGDSHCRLSQPPQHQHRRLEAVAAMTAQ